MSQASKISIIIPTYNGEKQLSELLGSLRRQTDLDYELVVVDSSSKDKTLEMVIAFGAITKVIPQEWFDHGGTRTLAALKASGDILVYLTQDVILTEEDTIKKLIEPLLRDESIAAVYGRQIPHRNASPFAKHLRLFNYPEASYVRSVEDKSRYGIKTAFLSDSFAAYRKSALKEIGYFMSRLILGEDSCAGGMLLKGGKKIAYAADAVVYHSHNYSIFQEFKRYFDIGVFHQTQRWLLTEFGKAESEGLRFVRSEFRFLLNEGKFYLIPSSILRSGFKYLGYLFGKNYKRLPKFLINAFSMHKHWWKKENKNKKGGIS